MWLMLLASSGVCLLFSLHEIWVRHPACHFFPLPLAAWIWLTARDSMLQAVFRPQHPTAFLWLAACHLALALASFFLVSPFLAGLAFLMSSVAIAAAQPQSTGNEAPAWSLPALSLFLIPPPMMVDQNLHQILAGLAARLSQGWLDAMQVLHVVQGTIVATPEKRFFVDDACSGTNSMLVAICVALIVCSLKSRAWVHALALVMTAGLISVASNVLRICLIIGGSHSWGLELDHGWVHEAVGVGFFMLDLALVWSADRGWHFILNSSRVTAIPALWPTPPLLAPVASVTSYARLSMIVAVIGAAVLTGPEVLACFQPATIAITAQNKMAKEFQMPGELSGWSREGEKPVEDAVIGKLGVRNQVWLYRKGGLEAYVAVNFPFQGFHDTRLCYTGQGWQFQKQVDGALPGDKENTVRFLEMNQPTEMTRAHLWLSVFDEHGNAQKFTSEKPLDRMAERLLSRWTTPGPVPTTYVLQVMAVEPEGAKPAQQAFTELLIGARNCVAGAISNRNSYAGKESE